LHRTRVHMVSQRERERERERERARERERERLGPVSLHVTGKFHFVLVFVLSVSLYI